MRAATAAATVATAAATLAAFAASAATLRALVPAACVVGTEHVGSVHVGSVHVGSRWHTNVVKCVQQSQQRGIRV
jgi:hypothetical protein